MTHTSENEIRVELKYCERCGGLWFRLEYSREVLCAECRKQMPGAALRHCDRMLPAPPERKPATSVEASSWYGPMTTVVQRLQGVAEHTSNVKRLTSGTHAARDLTPAAGDRRPPARDCSRSTSDVRLSTLLAGGAA